MNFLALNFKTKRLSQMKNNPTPRKYVPIDVTSITLEKEDSKTNVYAEINGKKYCIISESDNFNFYHMITSVGIRKVIEQNEHRQ